MTITIDDWAKTEIRIGKILSAEPIPGSEKLLKLSVDFGLKPTVETVGSPDHSVEQSGLGQVNAEPEREIRQILSGIAKYFPGGVGLAGLKCSFVTNLEPRMMMGVESQGMILATSGSIDGKSYFSPLVVSDDVPEGSFVK